MITNVGETTPKLILEELLVKPTYSSRALKFITANLAFLDWTETFLHWIGIKVFQ